MSLTIEEREPSGGYPTFHISDPEKSGSTYTVSKLDFQYPFFQVSNSKGKIPKCLEGHFTKHKDAVAKVVKYLADKKLADSAYRSKLMYDKNHKEDVENAKTPKSL